MPRPQIGDRVRMVGIMDDPDPLPIGLEGVVTNVTLENAMRTPSDDDLHTDE